MLFAPQHHTLNSSKLSATNCLITEVPSLMFSVVKVAREQTQPESLLAPSRGGSEMRLS